MRHLLITILLALIVGCTGVESDPVNATISLEFIHAGDEGMQGTATTIHFLWSTDRDTVLSGWTLITDTVTPLPAWTVDTAYLEIDFPSNDQMYYFAIRVADEVPNWSGVCVLDSFFLADNVGPACPTGKIIEVVIQ